MIVQVDYRIAKPYMERLSIMEEVILEEIKRRKKVVDLNTFIKEKAHGIVWGNQPFSEVCYSCLKPIYLQDEEILFIEMTKLGTHKTYLHSGCIKQKV